MNNIRTLAPHLYLTEKAQAGQYDLFMAVLVDALGDVDLNNATLTNHTDHIHISYPLAAPSNVPSGTYRFHHWRLTKLNSQEYVKVVVNSNNPQTMILYFEDADNVIAEFDINGCQPQAPHIFMGKETISATIETFARPSCIVFFDAAVGLLGEAISFDGASCIHTMTCGANGTLLADATTFAVNQDLRAKVLNQEPYFESIVRQILPLVAAADGGDKKRKATTHAPRTLTPNGNGTGEKKLKQIGEENPLSTLAETIDH